ncbi:hypothetical protein BV133_3319 [Blastochloris viridis]|uniref:Uncharacterized protein n=1 Tax=Blastochloris viridis TaxID=1079 RepID=A0A182D7E1_BLAVI|nr:hypothetical protein BV133_3319 [Blastochloris viridis]
MNQGNGVLMERGAEMARNGAPDDEAGFTHNGCSLFPAGQYLLPLGLL